MPGIMGPDIDNATALPGCNLKKTIVEKITVSGPNESQEIAKKLIQGNGYMITACGPCVFAGGMHSDAKRFQIKAEKEIAYS